MLAALPLTLVRSSSFLSEKLKIRPLQAAFRWLHPRQSRP
jgi:hypothetical protein